MYLVTKKGAKKMFGKTYNNCVKKEAEVQETEIQEGSKDACYHKVKSRYKICPCLCFGCFG